MEDIYMDDRRQLSAKAVTRENEVRKTKPRKRRFRQYLADLLIKSLITACFIAIDFALFAEAGSYSLFAENQNLNIEAVYILSGIAVISFLLVYLLSFSKFLQNLIATSAFAFFLFAVFNQFALFDKGSILYNSFGQLVSADIAQILATGSHLIILAASALAFFIFITIARRSTQAYFLGILLISMGGIVSQSYFNPVVHNFRTVYDTVPGLNDNDTAKEKGKSFIFLSMPALTSYGNIHDFLNEGNDKLKSTYNDKIRTSLDNMLGFYTQNNFMLYPNAYVTDSSPFMNLTMSYNPVSPKIDPQDYTLNNVLLKSYWDFDDLVTPTVYLKDNKLFDTFRKNKYKIKVYQTRGMESCYINNQLAVSKCIAKENLPINFEQTPYSTLQKTMLLLSQWLESTGLISNFNPLYKVLNTVSSEITPVNFSTKELYVANSAKTLDLLARDVTSDSGNNAYFATIDMPSDLYIYDSFCQIKPVSKWISASNEPWFANNNVMNKREAYTEQLNCLYGQLEHFMQKLANADKLNQTVIIIQGLSNPAKLTLNPSTDVFSQFKGGKQVTMAIYDPIKDTAEVNNTICPASSIIKTYLYKKAKPCVEFNGLKYETSTISELRKKFAKETLTEKDGQQALPNFINWYQQWADANKVGNNLENMVIPVEKLSTATTVIETVAVEEVSEIKDISAPAPVEELEKEDAGTSLSKAMNADPVKEEETEPAQADSKAQSIKSETKTASQANTPEAKKAAFRATQQKKQAAEKKAAKPVAAPAPKVSVKTKVIDTTVSHDVIPPFLEDDN